MPSQNFLELLTELTSWDVSLLLLTLVLYTAISMTVGGTVAIFTLTYHQQLHSRTFNYLLVGCILGTLASCLSFFTQVGSFSESGLVGMFETDFVIILWESGLGDSFKLQLVGWLLIAISILLVWIKPHINPIVSSLTLLGVVILISSFTVTGHTATTQLWIRAALILHVITAMWWMGSLYLLRSACHLLEISNLKDIMVKFGQQAMLMVGLLIIAGVVVAFHLEGSIENLISTNHGNLLIAKLLMVALILLIAAFHKWRFVPKLRDAQSVTTLRKSISREMLLGAIILIITAAMSSLTGPALI